MEDPIKTDEKYMKMALLEAIKGKGYVSPNPMVGAVIVKDNKVIATGYHRAYKKPHAEAEALKKAGPKAVGATIYVNLEPCTHWGNNPPCAKLIIEAGITRVVFASSDPNFLVRESKEKFDFNKAGIEVTSGVLKEEADQLNRAFFKYIQKKIPFITLKMGITLNGKIADRYSTSKWITNTESREKVQEIRFAYDAIMVGWKTVVEDDPSLNVRWGNTTKKIIKVIMDKSLRVSLKARIFQTNDPVIMLVDSALEGSDRVKDFQKKAEIIFLKCDRGHFGLGELFKELGKRGISSVLVEGGGGVAFSLIQNECLDSIVAFIAPKILSDNSAIPMFDGIHDVRLEDCENLKLANVERFGDDIMLEYLTLSVPDREGYGC